VTKQDLIKEAFDQLNRFKRHRALSEIKPFPEKQYHELQMYKAIDQLELALRAINKDMRETGEGEKEANVTIDCIEEEIKEYEPIR
jgi:hypothetical protein